MAKWDTVSGHYALANMDEIMRFKKKGLIFLVDMANSADASSALPRPRTLVIFFIKY